MIVPLYNHARYIAEAIASILAQGPIVRGIIVIDDGSTDASAEIMRGLATRDSRIRFRAQDNQGAHAAIAAGLRDSEAELLAILNSDDAYLPGRLAALAEALDADAAADMAASGLAFMDADGRRIDNPWYDDALASWRACGDMGAALVNGNFLMTTSNFVIRRCLLDAIGGFAALRYAHDLDFALRALALGRRIALVERPLLRYRIHPGNTIAEEHRRVRAEWAIAAAAYLTLLWDRAEAPPIAWEQASLIENVLRRHELGRAVHLCMAYLRRHGATPLDRNPLIADTAFLQRVQAWV